MNLDNLKYIDILQLNKALKPKITGELFNISILTNITINSLKDVLEYSLRTEGINPNITLGNYNNVIQDSYSIQNSNATIIFYDSINILDDLNPFTEDFTELKNKMLNELDILFQNLLNCPIVIMNSFSNRAFISQSYSKSHIEKFIDDLNQYLAINKPKNFYILDTEKIISQLGTNNSYDFRLFYSSKAPYTINFLKKYTEEALPIILHNNGKAKKALIFDCDNTLWKGILGEDGFNKIDMNKSSNIGKIFHKIQEIALYLSNNGIIIGLCSKNNIQDVDEVLNNHPDMILKNDNIIIKKVNWQDKATNLKEIAQELNIGIDSLVFVDDSIFEIELIKEKLPQVITVLVPKDIFQYPNILLKSIYTNFNLSNLEEDKAKLSMYKQNISRLNSKNTIGNIDEYLASLDIKLLINHNDNNSISRISQLTQKTNQFNMTTKRYTESDIERYTNANLYEVFSGSVEDKFGDNGLTILAILKEDLIDSHIAYLDTLLMSCRVIGRNIEYSFMDYIVKWLNKKNYEILKAEYRPTNKNMQVCNLYEKLGFNLIEENNGNKTYELDILNYKPFNYSCIQLQSIQ